MALALFLLFLVFALGWVASEVWGLPILRVPCVFALLFIVGFAANGFGRLSGSIDTSINVTGATHNFLEQAVVAVDEGRVDQVHEELRATVRDTNQTYEGGAFAKQLREAANRLSAP